MTRKQRELSADEKRLWRRVAEGVKQRRPKLLPDVEDLSTDPPPRAAPKADAKAPPRPSVRRKEPAPPADRGGERRVKRGQVDIDARLDLHGYTQDGALSALERFLSNAHGAGARTVLVITGYGRGGEGVLKKSLPQWIARPPLRSIVSGFARAHRTHGGAGAAYVFLKRKP